MDHIYLGTKMVNQKNQETINQGKSMALGITGISTVKN